MDSLLPKSKVCIVGKGKVLGCGKEKLLEEFYKHPRGKYGRFSQCKACVAEYHKDNKEKKAKYDKQHYQDNKEKRAEQDKQYRKDNPEKIAEWEKQYKEKRKSDLTMKRACPNFDEQYRIRGDLSSGLGFELRNVGKTKTASILTYIGCTIEFMQEHLNSTKKPEWGDCDLHKDHIIPRSLFDHANEEEVNKCWNWRNLRYIPAEENRSKGNTLDMGLVKSYGIEDLLPQKKEIEHE